MIACRSFWPREGAGGGGQIELGAAVEEVTWAAGSVLVRCVDGQSWAGKKAVITLPLGVLQAGVVRFAPAPAAVLEAAGRMRMGRVCRFTMVFKRRLWPEEMSFLIARELMPSVWWTARPSASLSLTGWVGGPRADALLALSAEDLTHGGSAGRCDGVRDKGSERWRRRWWGSTRMTGRRMAGRGAPTRGYRWVGWMRRQR